MRAIRQSFETSKWSGRLRCVDRASRAAILGLLTTFLPGCIYINTGVPNEWDQAMSRPAASIAGTYRASGESANEAPGHHGYRLGGADLAQVFNTVMNDKSFCPPADAVRLKPMEKDQLEITALQGGTVVATKTVKAEIGSETTIDGVKRDVPQRRANNPTSMTIHDDIVLMKGADGFLYVHMKHRASAVFKHVIPVAGGGETWGRFPAVP